MNCCETDSTGGKTRSIAFHLVLKRLWKKKFAIFVVFVSKGKCDCYCFRARVLARGVIQVKKSGKFDSELARS